MRLRLFPTLAALFIGLPLIDSLLLVVFGRYLGFWPTLGLVILSGLIGASLAKSQGLLTLRAIQRDISQGRMPTLGLLDAVMLLVASGFLMAPGFITDVLGLALLLPPVRAGIKVLVRHRLERYLRENVVVQSGFAPGPFISGGFRSGGFGADGFGPRTYEQEILDPEEPDGRGYYR